MPTDARQPAEQDPEKTAVLPEDSFAEAPRGAAGELELALANAEARAEEQRNLYVRAVAELDNFRKRSQRDLEQAHRYALERLAQDLLPVIDSLEAGIQAAQGSPDRSLIEGQEATLRLLQAAFDKHGIRVIDPVGMRFDPNEHEAIAMQDSAAAQANSVLQVVQKGYQVNGRLLRPARVIVARTPQTKSAADA
jgi:molecular chaperone GrpE